MDIEPDNLQDSLIEEQSQPLLNESDEELVLPKKKQKIDKDRSKTISRFNPLSGDYSAQSKSALSSSKYVRIPVPTLEQIEESEDFNIGPITLP